LLVFWASGRKQRLGKRARRIFQEVEQGRQSIIVPVIVLEKTARLGRKESRSTRSSVSAVG